MRKNYIVTCITSLFWVLLCTYSLNAQSLGTVPSLASSNVSEASQYGVVYAIDLPTNASYSTQSAISYAVNNSGLSGINFNRVAYVMQLDNKWVWACMDKFNSNVSLTDLGIPASNSSVYFQQLVTNLHVYGSSVSNVTNVTTDGTSGNVEIWPQCYSTNAALSGIGGNAVNYNFNDTRNAGTGCYGSFQIHNYGASQTLFAYNNFICSCVADAGIGNNSGNTHPDWTFMANANTYTTRKLYILVDYGISVSNPIPATQTLCVNATATALSVNARTIASTTISKYDWYSNTTSSTSGGTLVATHNSTSNTDSYTPATATAGTVYYYVVMTNSANSTFTSNTALVTVNSLPVVPAINGAGTICKGSTLSLTNASASGGTITYSGGYEIHTFTNTGSFVPNFSGTVEVLVVAGGGGGV